MATITLPTNGQTAWGTVLSAAITAINTQVDSLQPVGNSLIRATTSAGAMTSLTYSQTTTASTIAQRGTSGVLVVGTPTATTHATTKAYVDGLIALQATLPTAANSVPATAGAGVQSNLVFSAAADANTLAQRTSTGTLVVATPTQATEAATKAYVDANAGGGGGGAVSSVNAKTGVVVLTAADVNAVPGVANPTAPSVVTVNTDGTTTATVYSQSATANSIARREAAGTLNVAQVPTAPGHAASKSYVDGLIALQATLPTGTNQVASTGATAGTQANVTYSKNATGDTIAQRNSAGTLSVADPTAAGHAASKGYVDTALVGKANSTDLNGKVGSDGTVTNLVAVTTLPGTGVVGTVYLKPAA